MKHLGILLLLCSCGASTPRTAPTANTAKTPVASEAPRATSDESEFQVQGQIGTISEDTIEGALGLRGAEVQRCYRSEVGKRWYLGGKFEVKVRVRKDGSVKDVTPLAPLGNYTIEHCIVDVVRGINFGAPKGGPEAEFNYAWEFPARASVRTWDSDDVREPFEKHRADLVVCEKNGNVPSGMRITFFVTPGGKVSSVGIGAETPLDDGYARCVANAVAAWKFSDPLGKVARATYQFQ